MATPELSPEVLQEAVDDVARYGTPAAAARALGVPDATFRQRYVRAIDKGYRPTPGIVPAPPENRPNGNSPTPDEIALAVRAMREHPNITAAARALGISRGAVETRLRHAAAARPVSTPPGAPNAPALDPAPVPGNPAAAPDRTVDDLRDRCRELEQALRSAKADTLDAQYVKRKILGLAESMADVAPPAWALRPVRGEALPGVPVALWSDWHCGEVVDPGQVNGVNAYDMTIFEQRARRLVEKTVMLLTQHVVNPKYPGMIVNLGGDLLSGDIHEELTATNGQETLAALLDLHGILLWALRTLADAFGNLFVVCVPGNHGRLTRKPRAKGRAFTNLDWLTYQFLARALEGDARVRFLIPDAPDALYSVFGFRYLLTHGDQFRGGDGMIGHFGPVLRGQKKKLSRDANIGREFDCMLHGHFHTYFPTSKIIGNGSLVGYNEYAFVENFSYEPPVQALWLTHPEHGVTIHLPVYLEPHAGRERSADWISWR
jgi:hypothetical protein